MSDEIPAPRSPSLTRQIALAATGGSGAAEHAAVAGKVEHQQE
eukprot:CAMPEP_0183462074 /NCGR_PEP_ID=MMETSP0370-20130417/141004_1 /TAXON_ID=268820 /ORGANISM="Peridinium aciculiferum, Strain PAER-2" /LENGTH=42 /DNA_ID= /DNA_START= /DNA_END= /DNA_ORIENTATION=